MSQPVETPDDEVLTLTKDQLREIVAAQVKQFASELLAKPSTPEGSDPNDFIKQLALTMAEVADQGTGRKRVAPEILARRAQAHVRLMELLKKAYTAFENSGFADNMSLAADRGLVPEYTLRAEQFLDDQLIPPFYQDEVTKRALHTEIFYWGVPNDGMVPKNELAKSIFAEFAASVGSSEDVPGLAVQPYWVSAKNGVVIRGRAPARRTVGTLESAIPSEYEREKPARFVGVRAAVDPNATEVAILGTVMQKARQGVSGTF